MPSTRRRQFFAAALIAAGLVAAAALAGTSTAAARQETVLQPGEQAPPFTLRGSDGRTYSLSDFTGVRPVVLAWFPKTFATL